MRPPLPSQPTARIVLDRLPRLALPLEWRAAQREGTLQRGDEVHVVQRREHDVTVGLMFRALTTERALLPRLLAEPRAQPEALERARAYVAKQAATRESTLR